MAKRSTGIEKRKTSRSKKTAKRLMAKREMLVKRGKIKSFVEDKKKNKK